MAVTALAERSASIVEAVEPTRGKLMMAHSHALDLVDFVYRSAVQPEDSDTRRANVTKAVKAAREVAARLGYDLVPSMGGR